MDKEKRHNGVVAESDAGRLVGIEDYDALKRKWFASNKSGNQAMAERDALKAERDLLGHVADWAQVVFDRYVDPDVTQEKIDGLGDALDAHYEWKRKQEALDAG